jgi:1-acyl-sn-glycerol-3-phosphate acyltransferase
MASRKRFIPRNYRWFNKLLRWSYGLWLKLFYRIRCIDWEIAKTMRPPFVVVANHASILDPFILGSLLTEPVYWITSDGNMRTRLMKALLRLVGSIPKSKLIPDIETVGWTVDVIRKRGGVVGIFPEGQATWDGTTLPLIPSTAKLLKLLKVPVLGAVIKGGYLSLPRWTWARRRGRMEIEWKRLLEPEELHSLPSGEILKRLEAGLAHDEAAWEKERCIHFASFRKAEHLELALYQCPSCEAVGSMRSHRNRFYCVSCGMALSVDASLSIRGLRGEAPPFRTIRDWDRWQAGAIRTYAASCLERHPGKPLFSDSGAILLKGRRLNPLRPFRTGTLVLFPDRLELATILGERITFSLAKVEGINVLKRALLEFYIGRELYQVRFPFRSTSARKWMDAVNALQENIGRAT